MEPTELRIGNYVLHGNEMKKISAINKTHVGFEETNDKFFLIKEIDPVLLTRDRIKQLRFELFDDTKDLNVWKTEKGFLIIEECISGKWENFCFDYAEGRYQMEQTRIKFVHQLQNISFDLTGEELSLAAALGK